MKNTTNSEADRPASLPLEDSTKSPSASRSFRNSIAIISGTAALSLSQAATAAPPTASPDSFDIQSQSPSGPLVRLEIPYQTLLLNDSLDADDEYRDLRLFLNNVGELNPADSGSLTDNENGSLYYTPEQGFTGVTTFTYRATAYDDSYPEDSEDSNLTTVSITVENEAPVLTFNSGNATKTIKEGESTSLSYFATDRERGVLTYSVQNLPNFCSIESDEGRFLYCSPGFNDAGSYPITVRVTDDGSPSESDSETVTLVVQNEANPPTISMQANSRSVNEDAGSISINAVLTNPAFSSNGQNYSVEYQVFPDTADGVVARSGTLSWSSDDDNTPKSVVVAFNDDNFYEPNDNESFRVVLSNPTANLGGCCAPGDGVVLGAPTQTTVTINDDDLKPSVTMQVARSNVAEGGNAIATVVRGGGLYENEDITVAWASADGSAVAPGDYAAGNGTLTWQGNDTGNKTITLAVADDNLFEAVEEFNINLSLANSDIAIGPNPSTTFSIQDNDPKSVISFAPSSYSVDEDSGTASITLTRSGASGGEIEVQVQTQDGTALAGQDYTSTTSSLTWEDGDSASKTVQVPIINDNQYESPAQESFGLALSLISGTADIGVNAATVTINDDDPPSSIGFNPTSYSVIEGASANLVVARTGSSGGAISVQYASADGSASEPDDYSAISGQLNWADGESGNKTIVLPTTDDQLFEGPIPETLSITLSQLVGIAVLDENIATVSITDNDDRPSLQFSNSSGEITVSENAGTLRVSVSRTNAIGDAVSVRYATQDGTANAAADYQAANGLLSWAANDAAPKFIDIPISSDRTFENDESFSIILSDPTGTAELGDPSQLTVTISEADMRPTLQFSAASVAVQETAGNVVLNVERQFATGDALTVRYATTDGTATVNSDYTNTSGELTWPAGDNAAKQITIPIIDNSVFANGAAKTFQVNLSDPSEPADLGEPASVSVTINDDEAAPTVQFTVDNIIASESDNAVVLEVSRSNAAGNAVSVEYQTQDTSATAGTDYIATQGTLNWPAGDTSNRQIEVPLLSDALFEGDETFDLLLSGAILPTLLGNPSTATVTITESSDAPVLAFEVATSRVDEAAGNISVTVIRTNAAGDALTLSYATQDDTATTGQDYIAAAGTLSWDAGDAAPKEIVVPILDDSTFDGDAGQSFIIRLSDPSAPAQLGATSEHRVTINDNDTAPSITAGDTNIVAAENSASAVIELRREGASDGEISVDFNTQDGTATAGVDYQAVAGTVSWASGDVEPKQINVPLLNDGEFEGAANERFSLILSNAPAGVTLAAAEIVVELADDEASPLLGFDSDEAVADEDSGTVTLEVSRTGAVGGELSVSYATVADTAVAGIDFEASSGVLRWSDGDSSTKTIEVSILDDAIFENPIDESFLVELSNPTGGAELGAITQFRQTIRDNDPRSSGAPVGLAGPDIIVRINDETGRAEFDLTATQSNDFVSYQWTLQGANVGTSPVVAQNQPPGEFDYLLTVVDNTGATFTDSVNVQVTRELVQGLRRLQDIEGLTENEAAVARNLDSICGRLNTKATLTADAEDLRERCSQILLNDDTGEIIDALGAINGRQITGQMTSAIEFGALQFRNIAGRMRALREGSRGVSVAGLNLDVRGKAVPQWLLAGLTDKLSGGNAGSGDDFGKWGAFITGNVHFGDKDGTERETGFDFNSGGITAGVDYRATDNIFFGVAVGFGTGEADFDDNDGELESDGISTSLYGSYANDKFYVDGLLGYGWSDHDSERVIQYNDAAGTVSRVADGSTDGSQWSVGFETGLNWQRGSWLINPNISAFYTDVTIDGFDEDGARGLNLIYEDQDAQSLTLAGGASVSYTLTTEKMVLIPQLRLDYVQELENDGQVINVRFLNDPFGSNTTSPSGPSPLIPIQTDDPDDSYINLGLGVSAQFVNGFSGYVDWQTVISYDDLSSNSFSFGLRWERLF